MQLREWQQQLQRAIVHDGDAARLSLRQGAIAPDRQLAIYQNAYVLRLAEALRSNYPALHQLLGDDDFDMLAHRYVVQHPSDAASIRWFGERVAEFMLHEKPFALCPAMSDLARFEWALRHTVDAADAERITFEFMQQVAAEQWGMMTFDLHPSLTVLKLEWNAPAIWKALTNDHEPPSPESETRAWFVYRDNELITQWRSADANEAAALLLFGDGSDFDAVCDFTAQRLGEDVAAITAASWLKHWIGEGLLIRRNL
jgi:hypothetical protein